MAILSLCQAQRQRRNTTVEEGGQFGDTRLDARFDSQYLQNPRGLAHERMIDSEVPGAASCDDLDPDFGAFSPREPADELNKFLLHCGELETTRSPTAKPGAWPASRTSPT